MSQFTVRFILPASEVPTFLEAAGDISHDGGLLLEAKEEATNEESTFTISGNSSVLFALGQAYQATGLDGLCHYEIL